MNENAKLHPMTKYYLMQKEVCYGPGKQQLLTAIKKAGCVHLACENIGLSYSKAWKMIRAMEKQFGYAIVLRKQGGKSGGNSTLTDKGLQLIKCYELFSMECEKQIFEVFKKHFDDM